MQNAGYIARIDAIDPVGRQVTLNGNMYSLGEKIQVQYYRVGDSVEVKVNQNGVVIFMKKATATTPQTPPASNTGFVPAASLQQPPGGFVPPSSPSKKPDQNTMLWCNSVNSAIDVLKIQWDGLSPIELQEIDMWDAVISGARKLYTAGQERMNDGRAYHSY